MEANRRNGGKQMFKKINVLHLSILDLIPIQTLNLFMILQATLNIYELASAAGLKCEIDPALVAAIGSMQTGNA